MSLFSRLILPLAAALSLAACLAVPQTPPSGAVVAPAPAPAGNPGPIPPHIPHSPVPAQPGLAPQSPVIVRDNRGGNVVQMMAYRSQLAASGRQVQIRGVCNSACTMLTTLPNACLGPGASIGFHAPRIPGTQVIPPIVDQLMATTYRNGIRARWYNEWRHSLTIKSITAQEYVALDPMTKLCPR